MRIPSGKIPLQPLKHLWERHHEIKRRLVCGERPIDIAGSLGMTTTRLSIIMNSPAFQQELAKEREKADSNARDVQSRLQALSVDSMSLLEQAIKGINGKPKEGISPALQVKVAQDILDRAGYGAVQKSIQVSGVLTNEDIEALKKRKEMRLVNPIPVLA